MPERVLTLRELNRATLARQLLLERKRLAPRAVIERLVGMQAQWPPAPYLGIWTRTTDFNRVALERELARGAVVKAPAMRQTLHLVTPADYALIRAAMSETYFPLESSLAKRITRSVRALAASGPVTTTEGLAHLEKGYSLTGLDARRAWSAARSRAHLLHHHETAFWNARPIPRRDRRYEDRLSMRSPNRSMPPVDFTKPDTAFMSVVLPAPFVPMRPTSSSGSPAGSRR